MKRFFIFLLTAVLCVAMTACSEDTHTEKEGENGRETTRTTRVITTTQQEDSGAGADVKTTTTIVDKTTTTTTRRITTTQKVSASTTVTTATTTNTTKPQVNEKPVDPMPEAINAFVFSTDDGVQVALTHGGGSAFSPVKEGGTNVTDIAEKNYYWGSSVDLSANQTYGGDRLRFLPAALTVQAGKVADALLKYPTYGADGRVNGMMDAVTAVYRKKEKAFVPSDSYGLRAVGCASEDGNRLEEVYGFVADLVFCSQRDVALLLNIAGESSFSHRSHSDDRNPNCVGFLSFVFFDTETREVLAYAKPDVANATEMDDGACVPIRLTDEAGAFVSNGKIADLAAGQLRRISVLAYLDGEKMSNADVAAGASDLRFGLSLKFLLSKNKNGGEL